MAATEQDTTSTSTINVPLNQQINIANYMSSAQTLTYAQSGLQQSINLEPMMTANGQVVQTFDPTTGVFAEAFVSTSNVPTDQRQIVIGYEGLAPYVQGNLTPAQSAAFTGGQIQDVGAIFAGKTAPGAQTAVNFAQQVVALGQSQYNIGTSNISVTGQNLGGSLAQYAAVKTGLGGSTFSAPGIKLTGAEPPSTNLQNYIAPGDPFANYTSNGVLGPIVTSAQIQHYGQETLIGDPNSGDANYNQGIQDELQQGAVGVYNTHSFEDVFGYLAAAAASPVDTNYPTASLQNYAADLNFSSNQVNLVTLPNNSGTGTSNVASAAFGGLAPPVASGLSPSGSTSSSSSATNAVNTTMVNRDLNLSNYMYQAKVLPYSQTTLRADLDMAPLRENGKIVRVVNNETGVTGEAFVSTGTAPKQIIVAYEGTAAYAAGSTNGFTGSQINNDTSLFAGATPLGATTAANFAKRVESIAEARFGTSSIVSLTGHSLGASEAEYASAATGLSGATFGGTGIVTNATGSGLKNFVNGGDPVGNYAYDSGNPEGGFITSDQINHYGGATLIGDQSARQGLENVSTQFESNHNVGQAVAGIAGYLDYHHLYDTTLSNGQVIDGYASSLNAAGYDVDLISLPCYRSGTAIRTIEGDRVVEALSEGDVVVTASGKTRPIKWIGHRTIDCRKTPRPSETWPIRIAAHALGENRPARDLLVSPGHAICIDVDGEVLVPAEALVNGRTIVREEVDQVTYWHVELESHDILLAENLPAESYLEMGNRGFFANAGVVDLAAGPDAPAVTHASFCRQYVDGGPLLDAIRARLDKKADALTKLGETRAA